MTDIQDAVRDQVAKHRVGHLPPETQYKLLRGNAERVYRFTPAQPPVLVGA